MQPRKQKFKPSRIQSVIPTVSETAHQAVVAHQSVFDQLPESGFIREAQLVTSPKRPNVAAPLPFSAPTLWRMVAAGTFPKPLKLSARVTVWTVASVRAWMAEQSGQVYAPMVQPRDRTKLASA